MKIVKGSKWLCLEDVKLNLNIEYPWRTYKKGKVYISENNFCITDENSNRDHRWTNEEKIRRYFKLIPKNKRFTARIQSEESLV